MPHTWMKADQTKRFVPLQGQTPAEIAGLARAMREKCVPVFCGPDALDIVGTGGDGIGSVNISTGEFVNMTSFDLMGWGGGGLAFGMCW